MSDTSDLEREVSHWLRPEGVVPVDIRTTGRLLHLLNWQRAEIETLREELAMVQEKFELCRETHPLFLQIGAEMSGKGES